MVTGYKGTARPELLAPGGSIAAIEAALENGADAVYAGVGSLNARVRAGNLEIAQLRGMVDYVHSFGAKIYITLNVPVTVENRSETLRVLASAYLSGADAVIVRDKALMSLAAQMLPGLAVHASTQAGVHDTATASALQALGVRRVILAREMSKDAIRDIHRSLPSLELEAFVFGAMCFGVSGMCVMGQAVGARSGNYGACSQPCRMEFSRTDGRRVGRVFSMKDLDLSPYLNELLDCGVSSFKIEGRLKSPGYVGCVVRHFRKGIDSQGFSEGGLADFDREVSALYSRPRGPGFFPGNTDVSLLTCPDSSGHTGLEVKEWKLKRQGRMAELELIPPVDLGIRDGLLVDVAVGQGQSERRPLAVSALIASNGKSIGLAASGRSVSIPCPPEWDVVAVRIHSCDALEARYSKVSRSLPASVHQGVLPNAVITDVQVRDSNLCLAGLQGRHRFEHIVRVEIEEATGRGLEDGIIERLFPSAEYTGPTGLYVNPSHLKAARRDFWDRAAREYERRQTELACELDAWSGWSEWKAPASDDELLTRGPAAFSKVTGLESMDLRLGESRVFQVRPCPGGTTVRLGVPGDQNER